MHIARNSLSQLIDRVIAGQVIVIQRKDERVAMIPAEWLDDLRAASKKENPDG